MKKKEKIKIRHINKLKDQHFYTSHLTCE